MQENESNNQEKNEVFENLKNSTHEEIKTCEESLRKMDELLRQSEFLHKTTSFKRFDRELFKLMVKLDDIDVEDNSEHSEGRKSLLMNIHDLNKLLDSKVKCKLDDCVICKTGIELK
jgi:negative regulator of replication initiation